MNRNGEEEAPGSYRPPVPSDAWMFPDLNLNPQNQAPVSPGTNSPLHTMESGYTHFDGEDQVKEVSSRVHWDEPSLPADETGSNEPRIRQPQETCAHSIATFDSEVFSHLTDVTDWTKMQDIYKQSSICTEAVEETGVKNPLGFAIVCCAVLVGEMSRGLTFPTLWLYVQSLGGTPVNMGYCVAALSFGRGLTAPLFGHLSIVYGYRSTMMSSVFILALGAFLYSQAGSVGKPGFLVLAQAVMGVGGGTLGVTRAYVAEATPKSLRTRYLAYHAAVMYTGFTITPFIGAALVTYFKNEANIYESGFVKIDKYTAPAYVLIFFCLVEVIAIAFFLTHEKREMMPRLTKKVSSRVKNNTTVPESVCRGQAKGIFGMTVADSAIWFVVILNVVSKGCVTTYETLGTKMAADVFDLDSTAVGYTLGMCGIIGVAILVSFKKLSKTFSDVRMVLGGFFINMIGIAIMTDYGLGDMHPFRFVLGFFFVFGIGWPVSDTAIIGLFSKCKFASPCLGKLMLMAYR